MEYPERKRLPHDVPLWVECRSSRGRLRRRRGIRWERAGREGRV